MNSRLTKELRPLRLPWTIAAIAAGGHLVGVDGWAAANGPLASFLAGLAVTAFVGGVLVIAAMPVGVELQERTLSLLFSQPMERGRLWKEKLLAASLMVSSLGVIQVIAISLTGQLEVSSVLLFTAFAIAAVCSIGYYTLATRSVLVGIACAVGLPYTLTLTAYLVVRYLFGLELQLSDNQALTLALSACAAYSIFSLWLSYRQFTTLELKDAVVSRAAEVPAILIPRKLSDLFRARPTGVTLNLIRKEVCLHKPLFLVSAIFTAAWLITLLLLLLRPEWREDCMAAFAGLIGTQVILMVILGGCTALGDDKALGTSTWHLTQPVSARRQWLIKLLTALGTTFSVAVILPALLAFLTFGKGNLDSLATNASNLAGPALFCLMAFLASFWSASMTVNTVRAAIGCILTLAGFFAMMTLALGVSSWLFQSSSLQGPVLTQLLARWQIAPDFLIRHPGVTGYSVLLVGSIATIVALAQSLALFQCGQTLRRTKLRYAVILALIALFGSLWCADLNKSIYIPRQRFDFELQRAFASVAAKEQSKLDETWNLSVQELEQTGELDAKTLRWLKGSKITVSNSRPGRLRSLPQVFVISVTFPGGYVYSLSSYEIPPRQSPNP